MVEQITPGVGSIGCFKASGLIKFPEKEVITSNKFLLTNKIRIYSRFNEKEWKKY